jgi:hypothetical protein
MVPLSCTVFHRAALCSIACCICLDVESANRTASPDPDPNKEAGEEDGPDAQAVNKIKVKRKIRFIGLPEIFYIEVTTP